ncbi:hypothetical protein I5M27_09715 [Adhaeribacter sp. BT258]|uniref:Uncharacterized protein n=1 Tax=Adhaeribacter terrigena TaxID=2793070 RepID=A0ABS1C1K7_9BACT|nr:hypothetical protein [Adhaeribacter terrigena]MBK0403262.1 hypothetical protein [Adhaeribacter terrigena]
MESKVVRKKPGKLDEQFNLIGYRFKKIGFMLVILLIVGLVIFQVFPVAIKPEHEAVVKPAYLRLFILGLLLIAWSREKEEDERTYLRKVKSLARSFIWIVIIVLFRPLGFVLGQETCTPMAEEVVIIGMLVFQIGMFYFEKYNENEKERSAV